MVSFFSASTSSSNGRQLLPYLDKHTPAYHLKRPTFDVSVTLKKVWKGKPHPGKRQQ
jgi:hypothetical protein